jgi:hypothetical protein
MALKTFDKLEVSVVIDTFINPFAEKEAGNNFVFFWIITK